MIRKSGHRFSEKIMLNWETSYFRIRAFAPATICMMTPTPQPMPIR